MKEKQYLLDKKKLFVESKMLNKNIFLGKKAQLFKNYHNTPPTIFGIGIIDELNVSRNQDDQLELLPNGLLKYHCAYPDCPHYLKKFMTLTDIKTQNTKFYTRYGLMNHFKYDKFNNMYVKNYHNIAKCMAKNCSFDEFVNKMDNYYKNDLSYINLENKINNLEQVFQVYKNK